MKYAKLSCTEFYPCYLQQCHSIDLFSYRTPGHGQKGHMNKVCPSFCSEVFMELALQFFSGTQHGVRGPYGGVFDKKMVYPKMGKISQAQGSLNVQKSSVFFLIPLFFLSVCSTQCALPPPRVVEPPTKFSKRGRLDRTFTFRRGLLGKRGVTFFRGGGCNCHIKNKLKSEYLMTKKVCKQKYFSLS